MLIAEVGINHNGDLNVAKDIINSAVAGGADIVKFQKRNPRACVPRSEWFVNKETPWGDLTYIEYKERMELGKLEYDEIDRYCKDKGILWTASVWDIDSCDFMKQYDIPFIKIPSAKITDIDLLEYLREWGVDVVMSVGMSTEEEISQALNILSDQVKCIMLCNSSYPTPISEINLNRLRTLGLLYGSKVDHIGYSGHELGILPTLVAISNGVEWVERHITLDRNMWGTDQSSSLETIDFLKIRKLMDEYVVYMGDYKIYPTTSEISVRKKLRGYL